MKPFSGTTVSRTKYYALRRWIRISTVASILCVLTIVLLQLPEYVMHQELRDQHKELHSITLASIQKPIDIGTMQLAFSKIQTRQKKAGHPVALLKKIKNLCKDDTSLESLSLKRHNLQITLAAKNAPTLVTIADCLAQSAFPDLHISSLEPKEQRIIAILKSQQEFTNS